VHKGRRAWAATIGAAAMIWLLVGPASHGTSTTLHYTPNEEGAYATTASLGFNLHDVGPTKQRVDSLPQGGRALVWVGEKCPSGVSTSLTAAVANLGTDPNVYGYYLSDEPHVSGCPSGPSNLAAEADYIHAHAPGQLAFITLVNEGSDYSAFRESVTHVDAVGLDPYPCNVNSGCTYSDIDGDVTAAEGAGIAPSVIVPIFQVFGDSYYLMPTGPQLQAILDEWAKLVPSPPFDYAYSWGCQSGSLTGCLSGSPADQSVMAQHNGSTTTTTTTAATTTTVPSTTTTTLKSRGKKH
jgi:hypothetical protein